ncbi:MAG: hypothetical protein M3342_09560 [Bacteroidota bacterium]|nr:hypothetical protein [Flavisolibacter sp.]MBD0297249.1 hypothetical protein [Flavisolibacter sp.]MBD0377076.1 hypothetical protein [Flavisolibacter sp.]MDQ3844246.1 hypothetical protein [Bacteroidota bacterium]
MKAFLLYAISAVWCCFFFRTANHSYQEKYTIPAIAQPPDDLFSSDEVLELKFSGSIRELFNDRGNTPQYRPLTLTYKEKDNSETTIHLRAKTRGHFRRDKTNCTYPPILLNFHKGASGTSLFKDQDKLKLVVPCQGENFVVREYLVYKLYNLLTPTSFRARLVRATFYDSVRKKEAATFYAMLLEDEQQMAARNKTNILNVKGVNGEGTETETFLKMAVFQYMIGNTDWSVPYLHNIQLLSFGPSTIPYVVPYDFDHAGIVNAPYALPPEQLELKSTQERRFRGYCINDMKAFDAVIATFNRLKNDFYSVYTTCPLLDAKYVSATTRFLDQFYETINNPKKLKAEFSYPCTSRNNIVIKGLGND